MITPQQMRSIKFLAASRGVALGEVDLFSLTRREADRILARLALSA